MCISAAYLDAFIRRHPLQPRRYSFAMAVDLLLAVWIAMTASVQSFVRLQDCVLSLWITACRQNTPIQMILKMLGQLLRRLVPPLRALLLCVVTVLVLI